jgi:hypothetical protein
MIMKIICRIHIESESRQQTTTSLGKSLQEKPTILSTPFNWGEEKGLLLREIDEKDFYKFIERLKPF